MAATSAEKHSMPELKNKKEKGVKEKKILPKPLMPFSEGHTNYAV